MSKTAICAISGFGASLITALFGGFTNGLKCLLVCMAIDLITGLLCATVFKKSPKTESGTLSSAVGAKGLAKKVMVLALIVVCHYAGTVIHTTIIQDAATIAFIANEILSITENAGLMGVPIPAPIKKMIDVLQNKAGDDLEYEAIEENENEDEE